MAWKYLKGTSLGRFGLGFLGALLKNSGGNLAVRTYDDSADAELTASKVNVSGNSIVLNSDAAGSGNDFALTLQRHASQTATYSLTMPASKPASGQALGFIDDNGTLGGIDAGNTTLCDKVDTTTVAFGASSPIAAFTKPANALVTKIQVIVDTAFNGSSPNLSVGITGTTSKYMPASAANLAVADAYEYEPGLPAETGAEDLIITFAGGTSTAGSARVLVFYVIPG